MYLELKEHNVDVNKFTKLKHFHKHRFQSREPKMKILMAIQQKNQKVKFCKKRFLWDLDDSENRLLCHEFEFYIRSGNQGVRVR